MNKRPEITDATRNNFVQTFCEFYKNKPADKITVKEIVEKAGYSRVTFYNYFSGTPDILNYMEEVFIDHVTEEISKVVEDGYKLDEFLATFVKLANNAATYGDILLRKPFSQEFISKIKERIIPVLLDLFHASADDMKVAYTLEFYLPGILAVMSRWYRNKKEMSIENLGQLIEGILQDGILAQLERNTSAK